MIDNQRDSWLHFLYQHIIVKKVTSNTLQLGPQSFSLRYTHYCHILCVPLVTNLWKIYPLWTTMWGLHFLKWHLQCALFPAYNFFYAENYMPHKLTFLPFTWAILIDSPVINVLTSICELRNFYMCNMKRMNRK